MYLNMCALNTDFWPILCAYLLVTGPRTVMINCFMPVDCNKMLYLFVLKKKIKNNIDFSDNSSCLWNNSNSSIFQMSLKAQKFPLLCRFIYILWAENCAILKQRVALKMLSFVWLSVTFWSWIETQVESYCQVSS